MCKFIQTTWFTRIRIKFKMPPNTSAKVLYIELKTNKLIWNKVQNHVITLIKKKNKKLNIGHYALIHTNPMVYKNYDRIQKASKYMFKGFIYEIENK